MNVIKENVLIERFVKMKKSYHLLFAYKAIINAEASHDKFKT